MNVAEWESLCDGCGQCCLHKLQDDDTGEIYGTSVGCRLLDGQSGRCRDYLNRKKLVPDCIQLTIDLVRSVRWLPKTCAYRLIDEGKDLEWWHPLVSGNPESVHEAGVSVRGKVKAHEDQLKNEDDYLRYMTEPL